MNASELDTIVAKYDLNEHPFYRAWRAGRLSRDTLASYAAEYAPFIGTIELGWRTLGDVDHAAEEREHARLWERFRDSLGSSSVTARCEAAGALAEGARAAFSASPSAIGALYAFEAQQPSTARSKLDGLREHYAVSGEAAKYFQDHADDYGEREALRRKLDGLTADGAARALEACETTCRAMWAALDGILAANEPELLHCA
jgi:pyrroloquinoline-quinone synthase